MNVATVKYNDVANGDGVRVSIFVSGCRNHCYKCFNKDLWDFGYGNPYTNEIKKDILDYLSKTYVSGLTLLGGDPMEPENIIELTELCRAVKELYPNKTIWLYTGYLFEQISKNEIFNYIDVVVDGKYVDALHDISLKFKGSSNQRIIDVKKSIRYSKIILKE